MFERLSTAPDAIAPAATPGRHRREVVVGLLWHSVNSDNLGVGALTQSQIAIIEEIAEGLGLSPRFRVLGWLDGREAYVRGANVEPYPLSTRRFISYSSEGLYAAVRDCDLVCDIGGGDSFTDIYGAKRFAFLALSKLIVLAARRPLVLSPQTVGPFRRAWTREAARALMRRCRAVVVRDELSLPVLEGLETATRIVAATDVAFRLPYTPQIRESRPVRVGLNVSGLLFNGGYDRRNMFGLSVDYPALVRSLLRVFTDAPGCQVHLISHVIADGYDVEDDYRVALALARDFPQAVVAPRFRTPSEAKSYIAGMDFFSGSRMHACIAALSAGVPMLPLAYSRKFAGVFEALGYPYVTDCRVETTEAAAEKVLGAFESREALRAAAASANARAAERLSVYECLLRECLTEAMGAAA